LQDSGFLEAGVKMVSLFSGVWKAAKKLNMFGTELKCKKLRKATYMLIDTSDTAAHTRSLQPSTSSHTEH